jgi:hypothetical protein
LVVIAYALLVLEMLYKLLFTRMKRGEGKIYTLMLFFLPAYWYLYFTAPYTASMMEHNVRYAMPWLMLSMLMVVYVVYKLGSARKALVMGLMGVILWQFLTLVTTARSGDQLFLELSYVSEHRGLFFLLFVLLLLFFLSFEAWRKKYWRRYLFLALTLVVSFSFFQQAVEARMMLRESSWQYKYSFPLMKAYEWIDANVPADAVIANSFNPLYYPLYGEELKRKVRYININSCADCDYYAYHTLGKTVRDDANYEAWRSNLISANVNYIVLGYSIRDGLEGVYPYEMDWVKEHAQDFESVFEEEGVYVYGVRGQVVGGRL